MIERRCHLCKIKMNVIEKWEKHDRFAKIKRRYKTYECPKCHLTPTYDSDILTKEAADARSRLTATKEGHLDSVSLSDTIEKMQEIECVWCHEIVGRAKYEPQSIHRLEALCNRCVRDYERSIVKAKKSK